MILVHEIESILCGVESSGLMSKDTFVKKLNKQGYRTSIENHHGLLLCYEA